MQLKAVNGHAIERYAERYLGYTEEESKILAIEKWDEVEETLRSMAEQEDVAWAGKSIKHGNYVKVVVVQEVWVLLCSTDDVLLTLYKKKSGMDDEQLDGRMMRSGRKKLKRLTGEYREADEAAERRQAELTREIDADYQEVFDLQTRVEVAEARIARNKEERVAVAKCRDEANDKMTEFANYLFLRKWYI